MTDVIGLLFTTLGDQIGFDTAIVLFIVTISLMYGLLYRVSIATLLAFVVLAVYLFNQYTVGGVYLFPDDYTVTIVITIGLLLGFMIYTLYFKKE